MRSARDVDEEGIVDAEELVRSEVHSFVVDDERDDSHLLLDERIKHRGVLCAQPGGVVAFVFVHDAAPVVCAAADDGDDVSNLFVSHVGPSIRCDGYRCLAQSFN